MLGQYYVIMTNKTTTKELKCTSGKIAKIFIKCSNYSEAVATKYAIKKDTGLKHLSHVSIVNHLPTEPAKYEMTESSLSNLEYI